MFDKLRMKYVLKKVEDNLIYAKDSTAEGVFVIDKKNFRVKVQYNKNKDKYFFTVHRLKKDGKHTTFKSWYYSKYLYNVNTKGYTLIREGKYVWNK